MVAVVTSGCPQSVNIAKIQMNCLKMSVTNCCGFNQKFNYTYSYLQNSQIVL